MRFTLFGSGAVTHSRGELGSRLLTADRTMTRAFEFVPYACRNEAGL